MHNAYDINIVHYNNQIEHELVFIQLGIGRLKLMTVLNYLLVKEAASCQEYFGLEKPYSVDGSLLWMAPKIVAVL